MRKFYLLVGMWAAMFSTKAQKTATFDDYPFKNDSVYNGADGAGGFFSGEIHFPTEYTDEDYVFWSGFAVSIKTDTVTRGFDNQFSAITAGGADNSSGYAVVYLPWDYTLELDGQVVAEGFFITNSVYAYFDMLYGSGFTKKFGGMDGSHPDYFKLIVTGVDDSDTETGSVVFYLADFRSDNPEEDYLVNDWRWVDLTSLGTVSELRFSMESSDTGDFGMNTPAYFCMDNFTVTETTSTAIPPVLTDAGIRVYPNPVTGTFYIELPPSSRSFKISDSSGRTILKKGVNGQGKVVVSELEDKASGVYFLQINTETGIKNKKIIKY